MAKSPTRLPRVEPITIGHYTLTATGLTVKGKPSFEAHQGVGDFIQNAHKASGFWLADWLRYGESRTDWQDRLDQVVESTGMSEKTVKNIRSVGRIEASRRRDDVPFALHETVSGLPPAEQSEWLEKAAEQGWDQRELRLEIRASRRRRIIEGQAVLSGVYRVGLVDCPWIYGDRPPSGSGAQQHYPGMTIEQLCALPVQAHFYTNSVIFFWVTAPFLEHAFTVIRAWGFEYKTGMVWDKVQHNYGNYVSVRHEHLLICTRGSCLPDRPTPMPDSVLTERPSGEHSAKPETIRTMIEQLYDGPYIELFARERHDKWDAFGNDASVWKG